MADKKINIKSNPEQERDSESAAEAVEKDQPELNEASMEARSEPADDTIRNLEEKLQSKETEAKENYDRLLRVSAEFENYKKRAAREMEEFKKFANQSLIKELLAVVDNLELAMKSTDGRQDIDKGLLEGLEMTHKEILKVFERFDVTPISSKGQRFDPNYHEAVMQQVTDQFDDNTVMEELQKGYLIHDRLLRPAMVVVAKSKE
jgi:molecular chaperone GrpE